MVEGFGGLIWSRRVWSLEGWNWGGVEKESFWVIESLRPYLGRVSRLWFSIGRSDRVSS